MSARKPWFLALVRPYAARRIRKELDGLWVAGLEEAAALLRQGPVIFAPTHVSWWDAFLVVAADQAMGGVSHCLMDADNLRRLPFFGWIGAIPLVRGAGAGARAGLREAAGLCTAPGQALWVFPQGRQRPAHLRPLGLQPGLRLLQRMTPAPVVPVALNYLFREAERPAALLRFGAPVADLDGLERSLIEGLGEIDAFVDRGRGPFVPLLRPAGGASEDGVGARALARVGAP